MYILNTTCVCFRHTHERVDQFFSRLSVALNRQTALTLKQLLVILENAYRPAAVFEPLNWVIDFKTWLTPHLKPKRKGTSKPHQFVIRKADVPTGATIQTALWSHTELKEPFEIFNTLPTGTPFVVAGRSLFHVTPASKGDKKANAAAATGVATDRWAGFSKQLADISTRYKFVPAILAEWEFIVADLKERQQRPACEFDGWWPTSQADVETLIDLLGGNIINASGTPPPSPTSGLHS